MVQAGDRYSRLVGWLKILLPLVALAMLSTMFLLPRKPPPVNTLPVVEGSGPDGAREQIVAPRYSGTTEAGDRLTLNAQSAEPQGEGLAAVLARGLDARLDMADGSAIELRAATGRIDDTDRQADLQGAVRIESSTGYVIDTERLVTALDRIEAETLAPVSGTGPAGRFSAGKLTIRPVEGSDDVQLLFTGGVNLIYDPQDP